MYRSQGVRPIPRRRGAILIVVLALLALFAVIGLGFIYYADSEANSARLYREAQSQGGSGAGPPDSVPAVQKFLGTFVYDVGDSGTDLVNGVRGQSLARSMYGLFSATAIPAGGKTASPGANVLAFNGFGAVNDTTAANLTAGITNLSMVVNYNVVTNKLYDPERAGPLRAPGSPLAGTYVGKNAGYTYPDHNNFFLASLDPRTGEVLVPSFHRAALFGALAPTSPNWTSPQGRYLTLRPRPKENTGGFPFVPQNADGTYTGDVQNLVGGVGAQHNDSLWMDVGLPVFSWNGKQIKALVAPLVLDLDSRVNLSVAGDATKTGVKSHGGYGPWEINPNLILPTAEADAVENYRYNGKPVTRGGATTHNYFLPPVPAAGAVQPLPNYAQVNWGLKAGATFAMPTPTSLTGEPTFTNFDDNTAALASNHPSLFTACEWSATTNSKVYPFSDVRRLSNRYDDTFDAYNQMTLAAQSATIQGSNPALRTDKGNPLRMGFTAWSAGLCVPMLPPATLDYAATTATFQKAAPAANQPDTVHPYPGGATPALPALPVAATATPGPNYSDFPKNGATVLWANKMAALGGVDLNRPLADYRDGSNAANLKKGLAPNNLAKDNAGKAGGLQAWADRHNLARDIFARLIVATGANAAVDPTTGNVHVLAAAGSKEFEALRYLAQLAANAVDAIDADDVSTVFVWNPPQDVGTKATGFASPQLGALATTDLTLAAFQAAFQNAAAVQKAVVFGTEKPRVVLNEAYSEVINDTNDTWGDPTKPNANPAPPSKPVHVRFWLEMLNPSITPYAGATLGPLGDGHVNLLYEVADGATAAYSPYEVLVVRDLKGGATTVSAALRDPTNVRGDLSLSGAVQADIRVDFAQVTAMAGSPSKKMAPNGALPVAQQYAPPAKDTSLLTLAPQDIQQQSPGACEWNATAAAVSNNKNAVALDQTNSAVGNNAPATKGFEYLLNLPKDADLDNGTNLNTPQDNRAFYTNNQLANGHVVVLRRLANPYLPPNDPDTNFDATKPANPYVTVDFMSSVPTFDGIFKTKDTPQPNQMGRSAKAATAVGFDPMTAAAAGGPDYERAAVGRAQPLAGFVNPNALPTKNPPAAQAYPNQFLLYQNPNPAGNQSPRHTFGRQNGTTAAQPPAAASSTTLTETIAFPYDWLVHFDRPLSNPLELLQVSCRKPHELTQLFLQPSAGGAGAGGGAGVQKNRHLAHWYEPSNPKNAIAAANPTTGLYRALELLRVRPWDYNAPLGGKVHGRINLNGAQDPLLLSALLDPQAGNGFVASDVTTLWTNLLVPRTQASKQVTLADAAGTKVTSYTPGQTVAEGGKDVPFHSLGAVQYSSGATAYGLPDTLLRLNPTAQAGGNQQLVPDLWLPTTANVTHPYQQSEAARKLFNNVTPVSNTFAVWMTIGFFEVTNAAFTEGGIVRPQLGKEAYLAVPGDIRQQYFAVIDRTNLALDPGSATDQFPLNPPATAPRLFFTDTTATAAAGATKITVRCGGAGPVVYADGVAVTLADKMVLFLGNGADPSNDPLNGGKRERVTVSGTPTYAAGVATVTLAAGLSRYHPPGTLVTNAVPGNPGPQPNFDYTKPQYQAVVPYVERIR